MKSGSLSKVLDSENDVVSRKAESASVSNLHTRWKIFHKD